MATDKFSYDDFISYKNVSRETFFRLEEYVELVKKWQKTINLISHSTIENIWTRHIIDSVQLVDHIDRDGAIVDIGSGAGFPGLVLAVVGIKNMTLVESDVRKVAFLREAARTLGVDISLINKRVESVSLGNFSAITARGFAPLKDMLDMLGGTLNPLINILLLKGKNHLLEVEEARKDWSFDCDAYPSITEEGGVILKLRNLKKKELETL